MRKNMYELFFDSASMEQQLSEERVRILTMRKIEQEQNRKQAMRPLGRVLLAAAVVALLVGGVFAAPAIWDALTSVNATQGGKAAIYFGEDSVAAQSGYLELTPVVTPNPDAPAQIETYYVPAQAAAWTPERLYYSSDTAPDFAKDFCGAWTLPDGNWLILRQYTMDSYSPEAVFDTVNLGFDDQYIIEQRDYDSISAQCVIVPPSQAAQDRLQADEPNGRYSVIHARDYGYYLGREAGVDVLRLTDSGRKKLYWSDGDYLFSLEASYAMPDETLAVILNSLMPVDDVTPYVKLVKADPAVIEHAAVEQPLFPTYVPDGWMLSENSGLQGDESYTWIWSKDDLSGMELLQATDASYYELFQLDWKSSVEEVEIGETTLGDWTITSFDNGLGAALLWQAEGETFYLSSTGPAYLSVDELLQIAASLTPIEAP